MQGVELWLSPWVLGLAGLLVGSFLNVVIHRLPLIMERQWWGDVAGHLGDAVSYRRVFSSELPRSAASLSEDLERSLGELPPLGLAHPASRCPACGHQIRWYENIPVVSWLVLRGRCSACGTSISLRYPLIELTTGVLFALVAWRVGPQSPAVLLWCGVAAALVALSAIDWDTTVLPDAITQPLLWAGLLAATVGWVPGLNGLDATIGAAVGYLSLWSVYWLFKLATGSGAPHAPWTAQYWSARAASGKEGMGYGDFKLLAALGAWLGWQAILPIVLLASAVGAVVGLAMKASGSLREGRFVPFGPFLAGGGLIVLLVGLRPILDWLGWA